MEQPVQLSLGADELGVDSLVAVEVRSWFLKEILIDMPVLKILGGATIGEMLTYALEQLPKELTPCLVQDGTSRSPEMPTTPTHSNPESQTGLSPSKLNASQSSDNSESDRDVSTSVSTEEEGFEVKPLHLLQRTEPMSFGQSRFWFLSTYLEDKTAFNISCCITLSGKLRRDDLASAVRIVGQRHEALRTRFFLDDQQQSLQGVLESPRLHLEQKKVVSKSDVADEFGSLQRYVYDLDAGQTMRILLLSESETSHTLLVGYHHINMDGISLAVLIGDLDKVYKGVALAPTVLQYPDFSARQRRCYASGDMERERAYWKEELDGFPDPLPLLPFSLATCRRPLTNYEYNKADVKISPTLALRMRSISLKHKITPFHFYLAVFRVLLSRFLDIDDLCIGMGDANRTDSDALESIGVYLNLLPLRFQSGRTKPFTDLLKEAKSKVRLALAHSRLPFDVLMDDLSPPRSADHSPLFQAFIDYRPPIPQKSKFFDCKIIGEEYERGGTAFDIGLDIIDSPTGDAQIRIQVPELLYSRNDAEILMQTYLTLLEEFSRNPHFRANDPRLYSKDDVEKAIQLGRGQRTNSPSIL